MSEKDMGILFPLSLPLYMFKMYITPLLCSLDIHTHTKNASCSQKESISDCAIFKKLYKNPHMEAIDSTPGHDFVFKT
jgi:hypothetical protein